MASHSELRPDDSALPLLIASAALSKAESRLTVATGTVVADNADGTQTWIGSNGSDDTNGVIKWVGDLSAPGRPLGLSAACSMQCVVVSWDGTLENGVPSDFAYIEVFARREGSVDDVVSWGRLSSAGMLMSPRYDIGTVFDVYAIAYDDAHDSTGMLARNQSEQSDLITVAVEQDADMEQIDAAVEEMSKKAEEAGAKAEQVRKDMQSEVDSVKSDVSKVEAEAAQLKADAAKLSQTVDANKTALDKSVAAADAKAQAASDKGDQLGAKITEVTSTVNGQASKLKELSTRIEGVASDNTATVQSVTELKQTVTGLDARVSQNTATANGAMSKATSVEVTANGIKTDLSENYTTTAKADEKYSTKTELTAEADGLKSSISNVKSTAEGAVSKANAAQSTADGVSVNLSKNYTPTSEADAKYATQTSLKATADGLTAKITSNTSKAQSALDKSTSLEANLNGFKTTVSETYATNAKVDGISVGGTNMLLDTRLMKTTGTTNGKLHQSSFPVVESINGGTLNARGGTVAKPGIAFGEWVVTDFTLGDQYTLSFYVDSDVANIVNCYFYDMSGYATVLATACSGGTIIKPDDYGDGRAKLTIAAAKKQRVWVTWKINASGDATIPKYALIRGDNTTVKSNVYIYGVKLEKGSKPTDWSPAPEDLQAAGDYATNSSLQQTASSITARVASVETTANGAMSKATTVQQTANGIKTDLSENYTTTAKADEKYSTKTELTAEAGKIRADLTETTKTANGAMGKSATLETTVNGISTKISEQATTLNATVKTANEAKSTADSNKTTISQVSTTASSALNKATTVESSLNGFKTTVASTYAPNSRVDDLATGGSNLLEHVNPTDSKVSYWVNEGMSTFDVQKLTTYTGVEKVTYGWRFKCGNATSPLTNHVYYDVNKFTHVKDQAYTFSAWVKVGSGTATIKAQISGGVNIASVEATTTWTRLTGTYVASQGGSLTLRCDGTMEWYMCAPYVASCPEWITNRSYINQTSKSVALGVVQDYKGGDGSGLATKSDISVSRTEITSEVSNTYATKDGVSKEISSKITQNNSSWELKFATKTEAKSAQDAANTATTAAADAQSRVGNLEPCIRMTSDGVRVGKQANGAYQGTSALVGTDATFDVLDSSSKRLLEVSATGVKFPHSKDGTRLALGYVAGSGSASDTLYIGDIITGQQEGGPKNRLGFTGDEVSLEGGDININASDNQLSLYGRKGANLLVPDGGNVQVGGQAGTSNTTLTLRGSTVNMSGGLVNVNGRTLNAPVDAKQSQKWDNIQLDVKCVNRVVTVNVLHPLGSNAVVGDPGNQCEIGYIKEGYRPSRMIGCHLAAYNTTNLFLEINPSTGKVACFRMWGNQNTWAYFSASLSYVI